MSNYNQIKYLNADGEYFEIEDHEAHYMTDDEMYDASNSLQNALEDIQLELQDLVYLWTGHANFNWATLTPAHLTELNTRCGFIKKSIRYLMDDAYRVLGTRVADNYSMTSADYEDAIYCHHEFELNLMQVIQKSFEFSSGKSQGIDGIIDLKWFQEKYAGTWQLRLLKPITVKPWVTPAAPELVVPERPRSSKPHSQTKMARISKSTWTTSLFRLTSPTSRLEFCAKSLVGFTSTTSLR